MKFHVLLLLLAFSVISCTKKAPKASLKFKNLLYDQAYNYRDSGQTTLAFTYFDGAKDLFIKHGDSLRAGNCLLNMAIISTDFGDNFGGQELSLNALQFFNLQDTLQRVYISANYNNLGIATNNLKDYQKAIEFYTQAITYSTSINATQMYKNNLGKAYQELKDYPNAIEIFKQLSETSKAQPLIYAMGLTNYATSKWLQNPNYNAAIEFLQALQIREELNDLKGKNSSYSHLADYYSKTNPTLALTYAQAMYKNAVLINNPNAKIAALLKLVKLAPIADTKKYFERYHQLNDSLQQVQYAAKNQFALIRYEAEKHQTANYKLLQENATTKYEIIKKNIFVGVLLLTLFFGALIAVLWYRKRKQKLLLESQNSIKATQLKMSKKVHDVVANGLYRVMTEIENQSTIDKEGILDRLENMYEKSRDISYEAPSSGQLNFPEKITHLLESFVTAQTKILFMGNTAQLWENVNEAARNEVEHILQELLVNMKKHSAANNVFVKFSMVNQQIQILYTDDGIGIKTPIFFNNGLTNTGNRINSINGTIIFDTGLAKGLKIQISFPLS